MENIDYEQLKRAALERMQKQNKLADENDVGSEDYTSNYNSAQNRDLAAALSHSAAMIGSIGGKTADSKPVSDLANNLNQSDADYLKEKQNRNQRAIEKSHQAMADVEKYSKAPYEEQKLQAQSQELKDQNEFNSAPLNDVDKHVLVSNLVARYPALKAKIDSGELDVNNLTRRDVEKNPIYKLALSAGANKPTYKNIYNPETGQNEVVQIDAGGIVHNFGVQAGRGQSYVDPYSGNRMIRMPDGSVKRLDSGHGGEGSSVPQQAPMQAPQQAQSPSSGNSFTARDHGRGHVMLADNSNQMPQGSQELPSMGAPNNPYPPGSPNALKYEAQYAKSNLESEKDSRFGAQKLSNELQKINAPKIESALGLVNNLMPGGINGKGDVPGFGIQGKLVPGWFATHEGQQLRDAIAGLRNEALHGQFGARITDSEKDMIEQQLNVGNWKTTEQMRNGLRVFNEVYQHVKQNIGAGFSDQAKNTYVKQGGDSRVFSPGTLPMINPLNGAQSRPSKEGPKDWRQFVPDSNPPSGGM